MSFRTGPGTGTGTGIDPSVSSPTRAGIPRAVSRILRPDENLHDNGEPCPACALQVEALGHADDVMLRPVAACNNCGGTRRIGVAPETIIARTVAQAREHYWLAFMKRNGL